MVQNAIARIVAQRIPRNFKSPKKSEKANSVVLKLNSSKANKAVTRIKPNSNPRRFPIPFSNELIYHLLMRAS
jgi:hypothetical protein